ncbi:MAG: hypothetical protein AB7M12_02500 [Hyphomonadaceae bacterium]
MVLYRARISSYDNGAEGVYEFEERPDLLERPADEVVEAFIEYANRTIFAHERVTYELNGVMKHTPKGVVVGMGALHLPGHKDGLPFTIIINPAKAG